MDAFMSKKEITLLLWVSVTVGGRLPLELNEFRTAQKLEKRKYIVIEPRGLDACAILTSDGQDYLRNRAVNKCLLRTRCNSIDNQLH